MESAFWVGFRLDNFVFKNINISSPLALIGVCVVTAAMALLYEASRTLRNWLYVEFLKRRSCHGVTGKESPITLQDMTHLPHVNGKTISESLHSSEKQESNGRAGTAAPATGSMEPSAPSPSFQGPVMGTGTLNGSGKTCRRPGFHIGLLELSVSTLFHVLQVFLGYILMLVVMTFNVWVFLAVLIGTGLGFFVFDSFNRKINAMKANVGSNNK